MHILLVSIIAFLNAFFVVSSLSPVPSALTSFVTVLDQETVLVNWTVSHQESKLGLEIVYSPLRSSYYIVQPILNPPAESALLEKLLPFTSYQLVIRTTNSTNTFLQTDTSYFSTSVVTEFDRATILQPGSYKNEDFMLVLVFLILWGVVLSLFFQRWGKIRNMLPYQPVYSKEMADKIDKIETEKNLRSNRTSFSFFPLDCDCNLKPENPALERLKPKQTTSNPCNTSSTYYLPHTSSLDVDLVKLRKTKSADNVCCPKIVINKTISREVCRSNRSLPTACSQNLLQPDSYQPLDIPRRGNQKRFKDIM